MSKVNIQGDNRWILVKSFKQVKTLVKYIKKTGVCSFDIETNAGQYWDPNAFITTISISFQPHSSWVIPLFHFESPFDEKMAMKIMNYLNRHVFENIDIIKVAQNMKFEHKWFKRYGWELRGRLFDTMIAKYYLDENTRMGLKEQVAFAIPQWEGYDKENDIAKAKYGGWGKIPLDVLAPYNALDSDLTLRLMIWYHQKLIDCGFYQLFRNLRMMAAVTLAESEFHGMRVDKDYLFHQCDRYKGIIEEKWAKLMRLPRIRRYAQKKKKAFIKAERKVILEEIYELEAGDNPRAASMIASRQKKLLALAAGNFNKKQAAKATVNLGSPAQMADLLYESKWGFEFKCKHFTDKGAPSTGEVALEELKSKDKSGFISGLLELRGLEKLYSTYLEGMKENLDVYDYVHSTYKVAHTVTHRLSSTEPNIQNIPRILTNPDVKPMFEPPEGYLHLENDYSQAELRVVAELANDKAMIDIFKRGYNIHNATACLANGRLDDYDEIYKIMKDESHPDNEFWLREKKKAKTINFGILYGQGDEKLAEGMGVPVKEAAAFKKKWFAAYPGVVKWIKRQQNHAIKHGFVWNIWGYKRRLPDIYSDNRGKQMEAMRQAVNAPIQGAASDYTLFASIVLREMRLQGKLPDYLVQRAIVHDAIDYYVTPDDINWVAPLIKEVMSNPKTKEWFGFQMTKVDMKASIEAGPNWGAVEDYDPNKDWHSIVKKKHSAQLTK